MLMFNQLGGLSTNDSEELKRAKKADLITLPLVINGTNCFNCKFVDQDPGIVKRCNHPQVRQDVTQKMCCALWDHLGSIRSWEK